MYFWQFVVLNDDIISNNGPTLGTFGKYRKTNIPFRYCPNIAAVNFAV